MFLALEIIADEGVLAVPSQATMGVVFSAAAVGFAYLFGFALRLPPVFRIWYPSALAPSAVIFTAIALLLFGQRLGLTHDLKLPDHDETFKTLHPLVGFGAWFASIFGALHFSTGKQVFTPQG